MSLLLLEFNDTYYRDVAEKLLSYKVSPTYIVTSFPELYTVKKTFTTATIIDERQFHYSDQIQNLNTTNSQALSKADIISNHDIESLYLSITDRLSFYPKTVIARKQRYYDLLLYWRIFLEEKKITTVIFPRVPHLGYGNILYYLAEQKGIPMLLIRETLLDNKLLITDGYNDYKKVPRSFAANQTITSLKDKIGLEILDEVFKPSPLMKVNLTDNAVAMRQNQAGFLSTILNFKTIKAVFSLLHNPFDKFLGSPVYMEPPTNWWGYYKMIFAYYLKNRRIFNFYASLAQEVDFKKKYVYFALHFQPERTSMPEGDVFENQLLIIDIVAKALPKGWLLYVKEHPNQFSRMDIRKMNFRDETFYLRIQKYSNVKLVSLDVSSQELIKHSQAAVTLTGSTGWEALIASIPVITFSSSAWYCPCRSCYIVSSQMECQDAFEKIKHSKKSTVQTDVLKYLLYYKNKFITSCATAELTDSNNQNYQLLINNLARAIIKRL